MPVRVRVGDIYEILLPNGKRAYCQYTGTEKVWGSSALGRHIAVLSEVFPSPVRIDQINRQELMFPLLFMQLLGAV